MHALRLCPHAVRMSGVRHNVLAASSECFGHCEQHFTMHGIQGMSCQAQQYSGDRRLVLLRICGAFVMQVGHQGGHMQPIITAACVQALLHAHQHELIVPDLIAQGCCDTWRNRFPVMLPAGIDFKHHVDRRAALLLPVQAVLVLPWILSQVYCGQ